MAITQSMCTSFKLQILSGVHDFSTHTFRMALYTDAANIGSATTAYTASGEVVGSGYTAGGAALVALAPSVDGTTAVVSFEDVSWPASTFTVRGALIYNDTAVGNPAVAVLDFGVDKTVSGQTLTVRFPPDTAATASVRIA